MLRLKTATSPVRDFTSGSFRPVLGEQEELDRRGRCAGCCSAPARSTTTWPNGGAPRASPTSRSLRVERLYPLPADEIKAELARYPAASEVLWVQEEPANMGAWPYMGLTLPADPRPAGRPGVAAARAQRLPGARPAPMPRMHARLVETALRLDGLAFMYFTDRGLEELAERRGEDQVTLAWLAERLTEFVDLHPEAEASVDRLASWLARLDDERGVGDAVTSVGWGAERYILTSFRHDIS